MRKLIVLAAALVVVAAGAQSALADPGQTPTTGFFRGKTVKYLDFGPVKLAKGNKVAPIWAFTNGTKAQHNIIDTVPGMDDYTPLWKVTMLTWKPGVARRTVKSAAAVRAALAAGQVTAKKTKVVVNCPVLGFGQKLTPGYAKGDPIEYLDLGPIKLKPGNKVAPIWVVTNGTADQHNVVDTVPGDADYTPLWGVVMVTWKDGVTPRTLRSRADVDAAKAAGDVTLEETNVVVNCPVV